MRGLNVAGLGLAVLPLAVLLAPGALSPPPAAAGGGTVAAPAGASGAAAGGEPDRVTLQLKWVGQAQFAGYYAALDRGFYAAEGLAVEVEPGGPEVAPEQVVASGRAQFGVGWLASLLAARDQGTPLVNIAQVFTRAGMRQLSWKDSRIDSPADLRGRRVAVWLAGNEYDLLATLHKYGLDEDADLELIPQPADMGLLLRREVDAAAAMTYNELFQVFSAGHTADELTLLDYNQEGTAMSEDGLFVSEAWLRADPKHRAIAARFLRASFKGWAYCRDHADACVEIVLEHSAQGSTTRAAQRWQMDEVNKLIWGDPPDPATAIGYLPPALFERAAATALRFGVIEAPVGAG